MSLHAQRTGHTRAVSPTPPVSLHAQCTGHTRAVSPMPPGPVWIFSPLEYKYRNHVAPSACSSNSSTVAARRTCVECFTSVRRQCGLPFSCLLHNQLHYVQRTDTAGPVESLTASPKRTGYCKQAGGVMTDARNAVNCLSERKHKREGRHPNVVRCNSKSVFASAIFLTVIRST